MKKGISVGVLLVLTSWGGPLMAQQMWGTASPDWGSDSSGPGPVIFRFDVPTGAVDISYNFTRYHWMWISGLADSGRYLYASHNTYNLDPDSYLDTHDFKIAKIDRYSGAVLSDVSISGFLGQTFSQVNALDLLDGRLYAVENATSGSTLRGYALEVLLDADGGVIGAEQGAYVGPYPDCGLDYHDGLWYATSWGYTPPPKKEGSLVFTSPDIMNTDFTQVGSGDSAVSGIGMIDGWEFDADGNLYAVSWYDPSDWLATEVFQIDTDNWTATAMYDLGPQLPESMISLDGLSEYVPVPQIKSECKKGGWQALTRADSSPFKNQGDCIQYVNTGK